MNEKEFHKLSTDLDELKRLLILLLQKFEITGVDIAKTLGITKGQLSKIMDPKKYKTKKIIFRKKRNAKEN
ncbi:MAG: hypothetical protein ABI543_10850 [Ignavibacteria bacterium]